MVLCLLNKEIKNQPKKVGLGLRLLGVNLECPQHLVLGHSPLPPLRLSKAGITNSSPIPTTSTLKFYI
jgi:hypothetical protein